jgi:hypothetical protein
VKAAKWIVLVGGALAVIGFFLPLVKATDASGSDTVSAFQMVFGPQDATGMQTTARGTTPDALTAEMREVAPIIIGFWTPAIALSVIATIALIRKRMGTVLGTLGLLASLASMFAWYALHEGMREAEKAEPTIGITLGLGTHALLVGGLLGALGACAALFWPQRTH